MSLGLPFWKELKDSTGLFGIKFTESLHHARNRALQRLTVQIARRNIQCAPGVLRGERK